MDLMDKVVEGAFVSADEVDEGLDCALWVERAGCANRSALSLHK